ncbi:MAG: hypothetical protein OEX22_11195 [Cyclobacteriaceae bacterium]|nr:hypothetical protein [Cyclobacteriaceae bacterium]
MKIKYLLLLLISFPLAGNSQTVYNFSNNYKGSGNAAEWDSNLREALTDLRSKSNRAFTAKEEEEILQNSYYNKAFVLGKLLEKNKETKNDFLLRHNAFRDEIEIQINDKIEFLVRHPDISCILGKEQYLFQPFKITETGAAKIGYLKVLYLGSNFTLFIREVKQFKEEQKAENSLTASWPAKMEDITEFYFLDKSEDYALRINSKKKMFSKNVSKNVLSDAIKYMKTNKLTTKNKEDLITIYKYYDSLLTKNGEI